MISHWKTLICLSILSSCGGSSQPSVVIYSSIDDSYTRLVCRAFEQSSGIRVNIVTDSEAAKSTGLVQRIIAEKAKPVADVFWSGDPMRALKLVDAGVGKLPPVTGPSRVRLIVFNKRLMAEAGVPKRVESLADPEFAKRACFANPLYGTTSMHAATMLEVWGRERVTKFFTEFAANGGRMVASNGEVKRRVAMGEFALGLTDSDDVAVGLAEGKELGFVVPDQSSEDMGAVLVTAVPVIISGAPHERDAGLLASFLASEQAQRHLVESDAEFLSNVAGLVKKSSQLGLVLSGIKSAPPITKDAANAFYMWERDFLESWVSAQLQ
jgi:iron(III) transport system substrate-binding protein